MSTSVCVCVPVCLSARISPEPHARFLPNVLCILPIAVARSFSCGVAHSQGEWAILAVFFPIDSAFYAPYSGMNFATKDRFGIKLLLYRNVYRVKGRVRLHTAGEVWDLRLNFWELFLCLTAIIVQILQHLQQSYASHFRNGKNITTEYEFCKSLTTTHRRLFA